MLWIIIPYRSGSKGVPGKNTKPLHDGSTLAGRAHRVAEEVVRRLGTGKILHTTDAPPCYLLYRARVVRRPSLLATSDAPMLPVIQHALMAVDASPDDTVCVLQPTSPFRTADTVVRACEIVESPQFAAGHSVCTVQRYPDRWHPAYALPMHATLPTSRHDLLTEYRPDGGAYVSTVRQVVYLGSWGHWHPLESPEGESLSIDTPEDWAEAERRIREGA